MAVAVLIKGLTPTTTQPIPSAIPRSTPAAVAIATAPPSVEPTVELPPAPPILDPAASPYPTFVAVAAQAGMTRIVPAGPTTPVRVRVTLPNGWSKASDAMYVKPERDTPVGLSIGAWRLDHVFTFPCRWSGRDFADASLMGSAAGQAQALSDWWGQDANAPVLSNSRLAPLASKPASATIAGFPAWYVEVLIPSDLDFSQCDGGQLVLWETADGSVRYGLGPTEQHRLWVVEADGQLIVIDAASSLVASAAEDRELQAIIDSIKILG